MRTRCKRARALRLNFSLEPSRAVIPRADCTDYNLKIPVKVVFEGL